MITTVNRKEELIRAIKSVVSQTYKNIEIVVVIDGKNLEIVHAVQNLNIPILKVYETGIKHGGNYARNFGIRKSSGEYVALLDDDDEWVNHKLEYQLETAEMLKDDCLIFCSVINFKKEHDNSILPRKIYDGKEDIIDYLFSTKYGRKLGFIQTSTFFGKKEIFRSIRFDESLKKHQDWDWVIQAQHKKINFFQIEEPLTIYHNEVIQNRVGGFSTYLDSERWLKKEKSFLSESNYYKIVYHVLIPQIVNDFSLSSDEKKKLVLSYKKKIPWRKKITIDYMVKCAKTRYDSFRKTK